MAKVSRGSKDYGNKRTRRTDPITFSTIVVGKYYTADKFLLRITALTVGP